MPIIKLKSSDGESFDVDVDIAKQSVTIRTMLEDLGMDLENDSTEAVPLPNVTGNILNLVIEWAKHYKEVSTKSQSEKYEITDWDKKFFHVDKDTMYHLILAANYLEIKDLMDVGCQMIADSIKGKSPEQLREMFNIECDFTEEELKQVQKENEWCDEK